MTPRLFYFLASLSAWLVLIFYWLWMAGKAKPMVRASQGRGVFLNRFLLVLSALLLWSHRFDIGWFGYNLLPHTLLKANTGLVLIYAGVAFAIWARKTLGDNWSAQPSVKENHALLITGPYKIVRHPIYTGILLAILGTAILEGQVRGFVAFGIAFFALWHKSTFEENLMRSEFPGQYEEYARRVKRLIPFVF